MKKNKLTTDQVKTSPKTFAYSSKPESISKKMPVKVIKKKKLARASLPNIAGAETLAQRNSGTGMNAESYDRKSRRAKQGL